MVRGDGASGPAWAWSCAALQVGWRWANSTRGASAASDSRLAGHCGPGRVVRQRTLEGCERAMAPFIEDATAHPETGRHVGDGLAPEQREDGLEPVFPAGARGL